MVCHCDCLYECIELKQVKEAREERGGNLQAAVGTVMANVLSSSASGIEAAVEVEEVKEVKPPPPQSEGATGGEKSEQSDQSATGATGGDGIKAF